MGLRSAGGGSGLRSAGGRWSLGGKGELPKQGKVGSMARILHTLGRWPREFNNISIGFSFVNFSIFEAPGPYATHYFEQFLASMGPNWGPKWGPIGPQLGPN